jgi:riboflavin biosynthesis pyrimidine reductase
VADVVLAGEGATADPARVVEALVARGHWRLLTEGGPRLLAEFAAAGVLDELCLTLAPLVAGGDAARITNGPGVTPPRPMALTSVLEEDGFLFTSYRRH